MTNLNLYKLYKDAVRWRKLTKNVSTSMWKGEEIITLHLMHSTIPESGITLHTFVDKYLKAGV